MSKLEQEENEQDQFQVENTDDLQRDIGTNTGEDTPGAEPTKTDDEPEEPNAQKPDGVKSDKSEGNPAEVEQKPKKKSRSQRRIERITRENVELREQLADTNPADEPGEEVNIDDFDSYDEYTKALEKQKTTQKEKVNANDEPNPVNQGLLQDALEDGKEDYPDFDTLVRASDLALTGDILEDVLESEIASDILYHLATNKEETKKIAGMTPRNRSKALMKIELSLESKPRGTVKKKTTSSAPEPITPVGGDSSKPVSLDDDELPFGEYEKEFNRQQASHKSDGWA